MSPDEPTFNFTAFWIHQARLETAKQVAPGAEAIPPGTNLDINTTIQIRLEVAPDLPNRRAQVGLTFVVTPDPRRQPYQIEVHGYGQFAANQEVTAEQLDEFCRTAAPTIMTPYLRQMVHSLTTDGMYGVVRLNPLNVAGMLEGQKAIPPAPDDPPPSEQTPSA